MKLARWEHWLEQTGYGSEFPNRAAELLRGITHGVSIDFEGDRAAPRFGPNLRLSSPTHEAKISAVIDADVAALKKAGPFDRAPCDNFVVSPIGAVPKKYSEKIRVIHHLSFPFHGDSVNASIREEYLPLQGFASAADAVRALGPGCQLIKLDVIAAYKQVAVRREDWHLLGFMWKGKFYYERVLPFGLKSSCRLWDLYAEALHQFIKRVCGIEVVIHYIDDFLFVIRTKSDADAALLAALNLCKDLGVPMAPDKTEGPTTCLTFLGIQLDTVAMRASLPAPKLAELLQITSDWGKKSHCCVRDLQSLVGSLSFACQVVRPGRFFLRRIIEFMVAIMHKVEHRVKQQQAIPAAVREDIAWWQEFLPQWNGHSLLYEVEWVSAKKLELFSDACGSGYGAHFGRQWFAGKWTPELRAIAMRKSRESMPFYELYALVAAAVTWGGSWTQRKVVFRSDCKPVVDAIKSQRSSDPSMMHLLRLLASTACRYGFDFRCDHIPGIDNIVADVLSRHGYCQRPACHECSKIILQQVHLHKRPCAIATISLPAPLSSPSSATPSTHPLAAPTTSPSATTTASASNSVATRASSPVRTLVSGWLPSQQRSRSNPLPSPHTAVASAPPISSGEERPTTTHSSTPASRARAMEWFGPLTNSPAPSPIASPPQL